MLETPLYSNYSVSPSPAVQAFEDEPTMPRLRDLKLSTDHKIIAGVCAGIAEWLGWKRITVRIIFIVGSVLPVLPGFVVYIILWMILPKKHL